MHTDAGTPLLLPHLSTHTQDPLALDSALSDPNMAHMTSGAKTADPLASPEKLSPVGPPAKVGPRRFFAPCQWGQPAMVAQGKG